MTRHSHWLHAPPDIRDVFFRARPITTPFSFTAMNGPSRYNVRSAPSGNPATRTRRSEIIDAATEIIRSTSSSRFSNDNDWPVACQAVGDPSPYIYRIFFTPRINYNDDYPLRLYGF